MPHIEYKSWRPTAPTAALLRKVVAIVKEYEAQGFDMTVRQVYYQMVQRGYIENEQREYGKLKRIVDRGRLAGLIDWNTIVDRTRQVHRLPTWDDAPDFVFKTSGWFRTDRWANQPVRFEVWVEKEALAGVFQKVCDELHVPMLACRGYLSSSAMWRAARRLEHHKVAKQEVHILHFGDHDPSGMHMTVDNEARQGLFNHQPLDHVSQVQVERMALNMDQVEEFTPPPNPAKMKDPRSPGYVAEFGEVSWELDALQPAYLADLVRERVLSNRDEEAWTEAEEEEADVESRLETVSEKWDDIQQALDDGVI